MSIIQKILFSIVLWIVLMFLSTNLLGFFVRGVFFGASLKKLKSEDEDFIKIIEKEYKKMYRVNEFINVMEFLIILGYLYATYYFGNIGVTLVAILLMIARLPDLLWEIKTGERTATKLTMQRLRLTRMSILDHLSNFLSWVSLPLLYFSLYYF